MQRHFLRFRGEDHEIPPGFGLCRLCGALVTIEQFAEETCPGQPVPPLCECAEHRCAPEPPQTARYLVDGRLLCAACATQAHGAALRQQYAGLVPLP